MSSDIPVGTQFSAHIINLQRFCQAVVRHAGDAAALARAIWLPPVRLLPLEKEPTRRRASLPLEAARQYGLLTSVSEPHPTEICRDIAAVSGEHAAYELFAKHILLHCNGTAFVSMLVSFLADDTQEEVNADRIARYSTRECGLRIVEHNTAINTFRLFLERAGVFDATVRSGRGFWRPRLERVTELLGVGFGSLEGISALAPHQRAYLRALCTVADPEQWLNAAAVRDHAETLYPDVRFDRSSIVKDVLESLSGLNLVEYTSGGTSGGKAAKVRVRPEFNAEVLAPFLEEAAAHVGAAAAKFLRVSLDDVRRDLLSDDKHTKGTALEALAIRIMRALDLRFESWRLRAADAGFAEVDVTLNGVMGGLATRWQVQCKNTPRSRIGNEDLAREIGVAAVSRATHVLFVANAQYTSNAISFARRVNRNASPTLFLIDAAALESILGDFTYLTRILREQSHEIIAGWREGQ